MVNLWHVAVLHNTYIVWQGCFEEALHRGSRADKERKDEHYGGQASGYHLGLSSLRFNIVNKSCL